MVLKSILHASHQDFNNRMKRLLSALSLFILVLLSSASMQAQQTTSTDTSAKKVIDALDVLQRLFHIKEKTTESQKTTSISLLPVIGYNPSFGAVIGANMVMGKQFGKPDNTGYSVYTFGFTYGTKGILTAQARHNIFKPKNEWNLQGNWQFSLYGLVDYSLGTGKSDYCYSGLNVNDLPTTSADSSFPIKYHYIRLLEKVYRKIGPKVYAGAGISLDIYDEIEDIKLTDTFSTPHQRYSLRHDFNPKSYSANGLILCFQYNTREHPIRSYGGLYFDINFRFNQTWMGSTKNSIQIQYDFRKYWSLSKRNPEHVLAFWHWASYKIAGEVPYLELPATGTDTYNRSGRAYTIGYFRGPAFAYFESEYRYPITRNKLIGGVLFLNAQTASDDLDQKVFTGWNFGGGAGLRILFQKKSRSALCIDFSKGDCGSSGIFFGLNEVF